MATTYRVLGQSNPAATTATTLYTVPAATSAVISTINICNQASITGKDPALSRVIKWQTFLKDFITWLILVFLLYLLWKNVIHKKNI